MSLQIFAKFAIIAVHQGKNLYEDWLTHSRTLIETFSVALAQHWKATCLHSSLLFLTKTEIPIL